MDVSGAVGIPGLLCRIVVARLKEAWNSECQAETFKSCPLRKGELLMVFEQMAVMMKTNDV